MQEAIVRDIADAMLELSKVVVPQRIGTTAITDELVAVVTLVPINEDIAPRKVFDTLEDYIYHLIESTRVSERVGIDPAARAQANKALDRLVVKLPGIFQRLSGPEYRRCVLSHDDLRETNVLMDHHGLTGRHRAFPSLSAAWLAAADVEGISDARSSLRRRAYLGSRLCSNSTVSRAGIYKINIHHIHPSS